MRYATKRKSFGKAWKRGNRKKKKRKAMNTVASEDHEGKWPKPYNGI